MTTPKTEAIAVLRGLGQRYIGARRQAGQLHSKLVAIEHQRTEWLRTKENAEFNVRAQTELADIERVRTALKRSTTASAEAVRALESLIGAVAGAIGELPGGPREAQGTPLPPPGADVMVRGAWAPV